ncbi:MAG: metal-dependent hydrolase [Acidobacteria bacterium]|nr:metal-dependent hydrolase [Acidobacteriota bacterium]
MPSPLGHALAGAAAGWAIAPSASVSLDRERSRMWRQGALFALAGMLPDLDLLLFTVHRGPTHSIAAAAIIGLVVGTASRRWRAGLAAGAAYGTHVLLDWLGTDTAPPIGLMVLWPVTDNYFQSDAHLFQAISRRYWQHHFWDHNLRAVGWELVMLVPPAAVALWVRLRRLEGARRARG